MANPNNPNMWNSVGIGAATGAASSLMSGAFNTLFGGIQMHRQKELMREQFRQQVALTQMQNQRQDYLNANQALIQRGSMAKAGLNPNFSDGNQPNTSSSTAAVSASPSAPSTQLSPFDILQGASLNEDIKIKEAQRHGIELANQQKQQELDAYQSVKDMLSAINGEFNNNGLVFSSRDGRQVKVAFNTPEALEAFNKYIKTAQDISVFDAEKSQQKLRKLIADYQGSNKEVLEALGNMPLNEYKLLGQHINESVSKVGLNESQKDLNLSNKLLVDLQRKIKDDNRISTVMRNILGRDFDPENADLTDKLMYIAVMFLAAQIGANY